MGDAQRPREMQPVDQLEQARALSELTRSLTSTSLDETVLTQSIVSWVAERLGDAAVLLIESKRHDWFDAVAAHHRDPEAVDLVRDLFAPPSRDRRVSRVEQEMRRTGEPLFLPIVDQELLRARYGQPAHLGYFERFGVTSMMIVPLVAHEAVLGGLIVARGHGAEAYTEADLDLLTDVADRAALAIHNAGLLRQARQEAAKREASEALLRAIVGGTLDAIITINTDGRITGWNKPAENMFGWLEEEMIGARIGDTIVPPADRADHERGLAVANETGKGKMLGRRSEVMALHRDGHEFPIELTVTPVSVEGSTMYAAFVRDITDQKRNEAELIRLATIDQLTGLMNRREFHRRLSDDLIHPRTQVAVLFVDLDGFKRINDDHGHKVGDHVLSIVGDRLSACVRSVDMACRYGGDEFTIAVVAPPYSGTDIELTAADAASRIRAALREPIVSDEATHHLTASIGIALAPVDASTADELIRCADVAMYRAKQVADDRVAHYAG